MSKTHTMADPANPESETTRSDPNAGKRTQARELAMKLVYVLDVRGAEGVAGDINRIIGREGPMREVEAFARELYQGVLESLSEIDEKVKEAAANWDIERMALIDRALLRIAVFELLFRFDIPPRVTIDEALELSKRYSTEKSASFINGVLDKIFRTYAADKDNMI